MSSTTGPDSPGPAQPQRRWVAPCPACGAAVEFQSAASPAAVCSYCRSTIVRDGSALRRIGKSAEIFDDHSLLQIGTDGRYGERSFRLVGRLQIGYGANIDARGKAMEGSWNEWHALFADGRSGWLSEDNGQYVFVFDVVEPPPLPAANTLHLQQRLTLSGIDWEVGSLARARLLAAEGELPSAPVMERSFTVADLRGAGDRVATIDYSTADRPVLSVGHAVSLDELFLAGLRDDPDSSTAKLDGRGFKCPSCGAPVAPRLADTRSLSCASCRSVIDVSQGIGGDLQFFKQGARIKPAIPLGRSGRISIANSAITDWQVVGFARKKANSHHPDPEERFQWDEYLLYNRKAGFAFLLDTDEGWAGFRPMTGTPDGANDGSRRQWKGATYRRAATYPARTAYVEGEFYWKVEEGQTADVTDYNGTGSQSRRRLSLEVSGDEAIWSHGTILSAAQVGAAFDLTLADRIALRPDVTPLSDGESSNWFVAAIICLFMLISVLDSCSEDDDDEGSGGYSYRGGHK